MDSIKAKHLESTLKGRSFLEYTVLELIDNGKSAAVFKATDSSGNLVAIKVFDDEIVERFGFEIQQRRIEQEISLRDHGIPGLVRIIDGGTQEIASCQYFFIVMEYLSGKNLKQYIQSETYDIRLIQNVVKTLLTVSESLIEKVLAHRDIKPENIKINEKGKVILMDLGVMRLIGANSFTDEDEKQFIGTLRYAPPEFVLRTEEDSVNGWRAVNLYQIGGVLHDLLTKKELFSACSPYARLVLAIKEDAPQITAQGYSFETVQIARDLLSKDWQKRLSLCPLSRIESFCSEDSNAKTDSEKEIEAILSITNEYKEKIEFIEKIKRDASEKEKIRHTISLKLESILSEILAELQEVNLFGQLHKSSRFLIGDEKAANPNLEIGNVIYELEGELKNGFPRPLFILVRFENDETSLSAISFVCMFLSRSIQIDPLSPDKIINSVFAENNPLVNLRLTKTASSSFNYYKAFYGIAGFDEQFKDEIKTHLVKLIRKALSKVTSEVNEKLERKEQFARAKHLIVVESLAPQTIIINDTR